jgi:signal transduction histidine kinase
MKLPYFYQQMLGFLAVIVVLLAVTVISLFHFARNTALQGTEETLFAYADSIIEAQLDIDQLSKAQTLLDNQGVSFFVFNEEGEVQFPHLTLPDGSTARVVPEEKERLRSGERLSITTEQADLFGNPQETAFVYVPYRSVETREYSGFVAVSAPVSQIDRQMRELQGNLFNAFLISTAVAVWMSFIFARYQVKRINRLREAAHLVAEGDYDVRLTYQDRDELDNLSRDFNKMVIALGESREEVERQEERLKTFMQDAAHEMRTPLTTINGLLEGLEHGVIDESKRLRSIQLMRSETKRLIRLVNENLDYENIRSNRIVLNKYPIPIMEVLDDIREQMTEIAKASDNKLEIECLEGLEVYADFDRFKQIMVNLIKNAIQFTDKGEIRVGGKKTTRGTQIWVSDTGIGMTEDQLKNIWDRYYKADTSRTNTKFGESGLGLAIVQQLAELHDAKIEVETEVDKGTTFYIEFPDKKKESLPKEKKKKKE